jgi:hypothetical protein
MRTNLIYSKTGRASKDHVIETRDREVNLYSYNSLVCSLRDTSQCDKIIVFGRDYCFSKTTKKYLVDFLRQNGFTDLDSFKAIEDLIKHDEVYGHTTVNGKVVMARIDDTMH